MQILTKEGRVTTLILEKVDFKESGILQGIKIVHNDKKSNSSKTHKSKCVYS